MQKEGGEKPVYPSETLSEHTGINEGDGQSDHPTSHHVSNDEDRRRRPRHALVVAVLIGLARFLKWSESLKTGGELTTASLFAERPQNRAEKRFRDLISATAHGNALGFLVAFCRHLPFIAIGFPERLLPEQDERSSRRGYLTTLGSEPELRSTHWCYSGIPSNPLGCYSSSEGESGTHYSTDSASLRLTRRHL